MSREKEKHDAQSADFPDVAEILAGANYEAKGLEIVDPDSSMRYYFADTRDKSGPQGVQAIKRLGYRVSKKQHNSVDCTLMETPQALYDARMKKQQERNRQLEDAAKRPKGIPSADLRQIDKVGRLSQYKDRE